MVCLVFLLLWQLFLLCYYSGLARFIKCSSLCYPHLFNCLWAVTQKSQFKDCPGCLEVQMCTMRSIPSFMHLADTECPLRVKYCAVFCNPEHYPSVNCLGLVPKGLSTEIGNLFLYSLILPTSCLLAQKNLICFSAYFFHFTYLIILLYFTELLPGADGFFFFKGHLQKKWSTDRLNYLLNFIVTLILSFTYPLN